MPPKVRELIARLEKAGFIDQGGKGSHRNFRHPDGIRITISGWPGRDARPYQDRDVNKALRQVSE